VREFHFDPGQQPEIAHPTCDTCGAPMWLMRIEPAEPDHDRRTFECKACSNTVVTIVKYK
jgi:hypothetical protein